MQHRVEQRDVGPRLDREVQVGRARRHRGARIDDDHFQVRVLRPRFLDAAEDDRVGERRVGAGDEDQVGVVDVLVAARRRVGAERELVAGHRRGHAEARVGIDVVGADQPLRQLVEDVVVLGEELAGDVERDAVGPVLGDAGGKALRGQVERLVPASRACAACRARCAAPDSSRRKSGRCVRCSVVPLVQSWPRLAGCAGSPLHRHDFVLERRDQHAAADAAVAAGGRDFLARLDHHEPVLDARRVDRDAARSRPRRSGRCAG